MKRRAVPQVSGYASIAFQDKREVCDANPRAGARISLLPLPLMSAFAAEVRKIE
jgi:hypothetical protein